MQSDAAPDRNPPDTREFNFAASCPCPIQDYPRVLLAHGGGGRLMHQLLDKMILPAFREQPLVPSDSNAVTQAAWRLDRAEHDARVFEIDNPGITIEEAQRQLTKESGLKGLSGVSNDVRDITEAAARGNTDAKLALDVFVAGARHWIGSYFFEMGGAEAIVFTAGIGENRCEIRSAICANLSELGIELDPALNASTRATETMISKPVSHVKVLVIPTNEELVVARETKRLLESQSASGSSPRNTQHATRGPKLATATT